MKSANKTSSKAQYRLQGLAEFQEDLLEETFISQYNNTQKHAQWR